MQMTTVVQHFFIINLILEQQILVNYLHVGRGRGLGVPRDSSHRQHVSNGCIIVVMNGTIP